LSNARLLPRGEGDIFDFIPVVENLCVSEKLSATTKKRYNDTGTGTWKPEPGTVHNLCKLEHFAPQEIYMIIIYRGGRNSKIV
jgi:hypothetical protein